MMDKKELIDKHFVKNGDLDYESLEVFYNKLLEIKGDINIDKMFNNFISFEKYVLFVCSYEDIKRELEKENKLC